MAHSVSMKLEITDAYVSKDGLDRIVHRVRKLLQSKFFPMAEKSEICCGEIVKTMTSSHTFVAVVFIVYLYL